MKICRKKSESKEEKSERNLKVKNAEKNVKEKINVEGIGIGKKESAEGNHEGRDQVCRHADA